jgi:putative methionine-R-sulfoxide reductase with GAF domain
MKEESLRAIARALDTTEMREVRARNAAEAIRLAGDYNWVGIYDVGDSEIDLIGHTGVQAPAFVHFPATEGLSGESVRTRATVTSEDASETVVPILGAETGIVIGTLDAQRDRGCALGQDDRSLLEACAQALIPLFE